ncbi:2958_t:CDS:2, partial [Racocetra persica]
GGSGLVFYYKMETEVEWSRFYSEMETEIEAEVEWFYFYYEMEAEVEWSRFYSEMWSMELDHL